MKKSNSGGAMLNEKKVQDLQTAFRRILAMPITRSTFREMQTTVLRIADGDVTNTNAVFESLLEGKAKANVVENKQTTFFGDFINHFSPAVRAAKDVFEKGEFINFLSSDLLSQNNYALFLNRIRRIDGTEFQFISDPESTIHIVQHFLGRIKEMEKNDAARKALDGFKKELKAIQEDINQIANRK
jgi:hypothetical protein